ncbi:unnamed protein product [Rhizopus stolonifer]
MKFSITAISALVLSSAVSFTVADSYGDAMASWCKGLSVSSPSDSDVVVSGGQTKVTVNREPDEHQKTITGLDLYSVGSDGQPKYVQNVWSGKYELQTSSSIQASVPSGTAAGLYYYRTWVTNMLNGQHGPDCLKTSHTFRVTSGSHKNAAGFTEYAEHPDDANVYHPEHYKGCFGLSVTYPEEGHSVKLNDHIRIQANRDSASQTDSIIKVDLYKGSAWISTVWVGKEILQNSFIINDQIKMDDVDTASDYHYKLYVTSGHSNDLCTFNSKNFKIEQA